MPLDPQLRQLEIDLNAAISGGELVLSAATMGSGSADVVALFTAALGTASITIKDPIAITPDEANDKLIVTGTGVTLLYNVASMAVSLRFGSATPTTLSLAGTLAPPAAANWKFSTSFANLAGSFFDELSYTRPAFTIATYAYEDTTLGITTVPGGGLFIQPSSISGPLAPALRLINSTIPNPGPFYGPVVQGTGTLRLAMAMQFPPFTLSLTGFPLLAFSSPSLVISNNFVASDRLNESAITADDNATFGALMIPLSVNVPNDGDWAVSLFPGPDEELPSLTGFLSLLTATNLIAILPDTFITLPGFYLTSLSVLFDFDTGHPFVYTVSVSTNPGAEDDDGQGSSPTVWTIIPGLIEMRALTLVLQVSQQPEQGGTGPAVTTVYGSITGVFRFGGGLDLTVVIPIPVTSGNWILASTNTVVLPSLADLAGFVAGVDLRSILPAGVGDVGGFTLQQAVLQIDPNVPTISSFSFTLSSTNDWVLIPGQLTLKNLWLEFSIEAPFSARVITGLLRGTFAIGEVEVAILVERQAGQPDWKLQVASPLIPLPDINDIDTLIGTNIAPYLPTSITTLSFNIENLLLIANLTQPKLEQVGFAIATAQPWIILQDVLIVDTAALTLNLSWYTGPLMTSLGISGELQVVGKRIEVDASRSSDGIWSFRGALAAGETISLTGLVAQFLPFVPDYVPALEIEGLFVEFTTNDSSFAVGGQTAGFWVFRVSDALTLQMQAAAEFRRDGAGNVSGALSGTFLINNLSIFAGYQFETNSNTLIFRITFKRFSLSAALTSGTNSKGEEYSLLKFTLGDLSLGEILEWLVNLAAPASGFKLEPPWDALNQINFKNLALVVDLRTDQVTVRYDIVVDLLFVKITSIGLTYDRGRGDGSVRLALSGRFLTKTYEIDDGTALEWDVLHDPPPEVPAEGPQLIDLKYVGLGQRVSFADTKQLNSVGQVLAALKKDMRPPKNAARNPLSAGNGSLMRFDRGSQILFGVEFVILETFSASLIFNDPYLYGMRIGLAGERAGSLAGLQFELLYKRITADIGVFKIELRVPDAFRQFDVGQVSITLPVIKVDIYTNGNFRVDLGFPHNGDFADSFCLQVFPFIGYGGLYFAALTGATSERVPRITNGTFDPVIEFGLGLQVGVGKEIRKGPLSGGIYVVVQGILEGVFAWFTPNDAAAADGTYYWIKGLVGIVGKVYGKVDFVVIKVSVSVTARLTVTVVIEAYEPIYLAVEVSVEAEATVTILFIDVDFSFQLDLKVEFVIGEKTKSPWTIAAGGTTALAATQPQLRLARSQYRLRPAARDLLRELTARAIESTRLRLVRDAAAVWTPLLVFDAKKDIAATLLPAFTLAGQTPALQVALTMFVENSVAPEASTRAQRRTASSEHSARATAPEEMPFNLLAASMLRWSIHAVTGILDGNVTAAQLEAVYATLIDPATFSAGFNWPNLNTFLGLNFAMSVSGLPVGVESVTDPTVSSTVFPVVPLFSYSGAGQTVDFFTYQPVTAAYEQTILEYYEQLVVDYEFGRAHTPGDSFPGAASLRTGEDDDQQSMATLIFREYFMILARSAAQAAIDLLAKFNYTTGANDSLTYIAGLFPAAVVPYTAIAGDGVASIAAKFGLTVAELESRNDAFTDPLVPGTTVQVELRITPAAIAIANPAAPLTTGKPLPLAHVLRQVRTGDTFASIAALFSTTTAGLANIAVNQNNRLLLRAGATIAIAAAEASAFNYFPYTSVTGDSLMTLAAWAYIRALGGAAGANVAWYAQTITNFNTDPEHPYAGPNLSGVIATGTSLLVPSALGNSNKAAALTYVSRAGDTVDLIARYFDTIQNAPGLLAPNEQLLRSLNPDVDFNSLPAGTLLKMPAQTRTVQGADTLASLATLFLIQPSDLAAGTNASSATLLAPLAVVAVPPFTYTTRAGDDLAGVAAAMDMTLEAFATEVAGVQGLLVAATQLFITNVPAYGIDALCSQFVQQGGANEAAMSVSRFLASGLQLPLPSSAGEKPTPATPLGGLYALTGQQFASATTLPYTITVTNTATWISFVESALATGANEERTRIDVRRNRGTATRVRPGMLLLGDTLDGDLGITITQALVDAQAPSTTFNPAILTGPSAAPLVRPTRVDYNFERTILWQTAETLPFNNPAGAPPAGQPTIWMFSEALEARAIELGFGTTPFGLFTRAADAAETDDVPVARWSWGAAINLFVRRATSATPEGTPLPNTYELAGSDDRGKETLLALLNYLSSTSGATASIHIVYTPNASSNNANGVASSVVDPAQTFVLRTNLSTITTSGPQLRDESLDATTTDAALYAATIADAAKFIQLVWEAAVTASGGYVLQYMTAGGDGLPDEVFAATSLGELRLVVLAGAQSAGTDRTIRAFNNCAVAGDNLDPSSQTVFAQTTDAAKIEYRDAVDIPPGTAAFALTRRNPAAPTQPVTPPAEVRTQQLFSLLGYRTTAGGGYSASLAGLPVSPVVPDDPALKTTTWQYEQALSLTRLATSTLPSVPFLPPREQDPYSGIAASSAVSLAFAFRDLYGNEIAPTTPVRPLTIETGYYDDVIGFAQWPGISSSYLVTGTPAAPAIELTAALQVLNYVPGGGTSYQAAHDAADAHRIRFGNIWYQVWQNGITASLTTSLVLDSTTHEPVKLNVDRVHLGWFVNGTYTFLGTALQLAPAEYTILADNTFDSIARRYSTVPAALAATIAAIGDANRETATSAIFSANVVVPRYATTAYGDTLATLASAASLTVLQLATRNALVELNAGVDVLAPERTVVTAAGNRLDALALAEKVVVSGIANANAPTQGLFAEHVRLTVQGVTIEVGLDSQSGKTWSFNDLVPRFQLLGVTTTPGGIAFANETVENIFATGVTLLLHDYVIQPRDTFTSLGQTYPAFTLEAFSAAAENSANLFPSGIPLYIGTATTLPPSSQTLRTIAVTQGLTVAQLALANSTTALVTGNAIVLPDRVTIDFAAATALAPYSATANEKIDDIVTTFGESSAYVFATRNWNVTYVFIPTNIRIGNAATDTVPADSFGTVYTRLHAQTPDLTEEVYVDAIRGSAILRDGAFFATILPSSGNAVTSLDHLAETFNSTPALLAQINASLQGFVAEGVPVSLGPLTLTTNFDETFTSLVSRFAIELGVQTTVAELATGNSPAALIVANVHFLLPPAPLEVSVPLPVSATPVYAGNPFRLLTELTIERPEDLIAEELEDVDAVRFSSALIAPRAVQQIQPGNGLSLEVFAAALEIAYPKLKVAVGGGALTDAGNSGARNVWITDFGPGGISSIDIAAATPAFFSIPPLSTSLVDLTAVPIRAFDPATGTLVPADDPPLLDFQAVDLDVWAGSFLAAVDQLLTPAYAANAYRLAPTQLTNVIAAKSALAQSISAGVTNILNDRTGVPADARERVRQELLATLAGGYATAAVVQYPVTVASTFTSKPAAPRLSGKPVAKVYRTGDADVIATIATHYGVAAAGVAMLLGGVVRILATGHAITFNGTPYTILPDETINAVMLRVGAASYQDFVDRLAAPDGFFLAQTVISIEAVTSRLGAAIQNGTRLTFSDLVSYFAMPLELLATEVQDQHGIFRIGVTIAVEGHGSVVVDNANNTLRLIAAALAFSSAAELAEAIGLQTGKLDPEFEASLVRFVPQHDLSASKLSLFNGASTTNFLLNVKSESALRSLFLDLDYRLNELEYDVTPVGTSGYVSSSWLSFVLPISAGAGVVDTDLGQVDIPIPLREYPNVPSMLEQTGTPPSLPPTTVAAAKQWNFAFSYQHRDAAQDTLYLTTTFNTPLAPDFAREMASLPAFGAALAQFISAWPAVNTALTALLTWNGQPNPVLAQTVATFAGMVSAVAANWTFGSMLPEPSTSTYAWRTATTLKTNPDLGPDLLDTLILRVAGATNAPPFPQVAWRATAADPWMPLQQSEVSEVEAGYRYLEEVPAFRTIQHRLTFEQLDVVATQNAAGAARLTRNENLIAGRATNSAFIYRTNEVAFPNPLVPLLSPEDLIVFNDGRPLRDALTALFTTLLGPNATDYFVKTSIQFGYELVATVVPVRPIVSFLPIAFLPATQYTAALPGQIDDVVTAWRTGKPFGPTEGLYVLDITVFTTLTPPAASKIPILRLPHLAYDNGAGGNALRVFARG
jgi:LysM repeat protein